MQGVALRDHLNERFGQHYGTEPGTKRIKNIFIIVVLCAVGLSGWIQVASWQWARLDAATVFRARIASEAPAGSVVSLQPATILAGNLSDAARLICGSVSIGAIGRLPQVRLYSLVVVKELFGYAINDGFTPATRPENQTISDQECASLRAHAAANPGAASRQP